MSSLKGFMVMISTLVTISVVFCAPEPSHNGTAVNFPFEVGTHWVYQFSHGDDREDRIIKATREKGGTTLVYVQQNGSEPKSVRKN
jgi:hypothetical protein